MFTLPGIALTYKNRSSKMTDHEFVVVLQEVTFCFTRGLSLHVQNQFRKNNFKKINVTSANLRRDGSFDVIFHL